LQSQLDRLNMDVETDAEVGEAFNVQTTVKKSTKKSD
jgi:hypothetical protein